MFHRHKDGLLQDYVAIQNHNSSTAIERSVIHADNYFYAKDVTGILHALRERLRTHKLFTKDLCFTLIIVSSP